MIYCMKKTRVKLLDDQIKLWWFNRATQTNNLFALAFFAEVENQWREGVLQGWSFLAEDLALGGGTVAQLAKIWKMFFSLSHKIWKVPQIDVEKMS